MNDLLRIEKTCAVCVVVSLNCWLVACNAFADDTSQVATVQQLLKTASEQERWTTEVRTMHFRSAGICVRSQAAIDAELAKIREQFPDADEPFESPNLFPRTEVSLEFVWDGERIAMVSRTSPGMTIQHSVWEGKRLTVFNNGQLRSFLLDDEISLELKSPLAAGSLWPFTPGYVLQTVEPHESVETFDATDFALFPPAEFHGVLCHRLVSLPDQVSLFIDSTSGRIIGKRHIAILPSQLRMLSELGHAVTSEDEAKALFAKLTQPQRKELQKAGEDLQRRHVSKSLLEGPASQEYWVEDFQEIARGDFPMKQNHLANMLDEDGNVCEQSQTAWTVTKLDVNQVIDEELFELPLIPGVTVVDQRFLADITYKYDADQTQQELDELVRAKLGIKSSLDKLIGKPVPADDKLKWLNTEFTSLHDFRGKPLLIECWSVSCAPCRNHFATLNAMHKDERIHVLGFHSATQDVAAIEELQRKLNLNYPIIVDAAEDAAGNFGSLPVVQMPYTILVDKGGTVVAHGNLETLLTQAIKLAEPK